MCDRMKYHGLGHNKTKRWLKTVCAFANGIGETIIFDIDDRHANSFLLKICRLKSNL